MGAMMIGWLLLVLLVIAAIWIAASYNRRPAPPGQDSARRILAERYARGELDAEEYHRRLDTLR
ncbi:SHOCT domain-containing protein [Micromonospora sp. U56]|nr:SHOCT domain-containing protein [Micromonospora sp. U56]